MEWHGVSKERIENAEAGNVVTDFLNLSITRVSARVAPRDGKNMFSTSDGGAEIEEVMRARRRAPAVSNTNEYKAGSLVELATLPYVTLAPVSSGHPG